MSEWLIEQLKTSKNLCDVALILAEANQNHLMPTILELLLQEVQTIVDENCVVATEPPKSL
jgi:hypothetical protein